MDMYHNKHIKRGFVAVALLFILVFPAQSFAAATLQYKPQTQAEMLAYLYGRIAQLMQIKQLLDQGNTLQQATEQATVDFVTVDTHSAREIEDTTAILRGEVNLFGDATATAWFEYGQDEDFLDQRTYRRYIRTAYDRALRENVTRLEEDERYYFRIVATDKDGLVYYGTVHSFRTDESE